MTVIYKILNTINGKLYIGSAVNFIKRKNVHLAYLRAGDHHSKHLQYAWNLHGEAAFEFIIIEYCEKDKLIEREQFWMDWTRCTNSDLGYNMLPKAGSSLGSKRTIEQIEKMKASLKGFKHTDEAKAKMKGHQRNKGTKRTLEQRLKMSASMKGVKRSEEARRNMSLCKLGKTHTEEAKARMKIAQRKISNWPHSDGKKCKCLECTKRRNEASKISNRKYYEKTKIKH